MITQPYPSFIDPEVGGRAKPVSNGTIFIGQNQKDAIQFPEKVYYIDENGTEIEMAQPIHLNSAGVTVASKTQSDVVRPYTKTASYSILIRNSSGNDRYANDSVSGFVTAKELDEAQNDIIGGSIFKGSNGDYVQSGDTVPTGTTHLRVLASGKPSIASFYPITSGVVSSITDTGATIGGVSVKFRLASKVYFQSVQHMLDADVPIGSLCNTGLGEWLRASNDINLSAFDPIGDVFIDDFATYHNDESRPFDMVLEILIDKGASVVSKGENEVYVSDTIKFKNKCSFGGDVTFKPVTMFAGSNLAQVTSSNVSLSCILDGLSILPSFDVPYIGGVPFVGAGVICSSDPESPVTGAGKVKLKNVDLAGLRVRNTPNSGIVLESCDESSTSNTDTYNTSYDEIKSPPASLYHIGCDDLDCNKNNNHRIIKNGLGNAKDITINNCKRFNCKDNRTKRTYEDETPVVEHGFHTHVFVKASSGGEVSGNKGHDVGIGVKVEADCVGVSTHDNNYELVYDYILIAQGHIKCEYFDNTGNKTRRYGFALDVHSPSSSQCLSNFFTNNKVISSNEMDTDGLSSDNRAAYVIRAIAGLKNIGSVLRGNYCDAGKNAAYAMILFTDNPSSNESEIKDVNINDHIFSGSYSSALIGLSGRINGVNFESPILNDVVCPVIFRKFLYTNPVVDLSFSGAKISNGCNFSSIIQSGTYGGNLEISNMTDNSSQSSFTVRIDSCNLDSFVYSGNSGTRDDGSNILVSSSTIESISIKSNEHSHADNNPYFLLIDSGSDFGILSLSENSHRGRGKYIIQGGSGKVAISDNSATTLSEVEIDSGLTLTGYIGYNNLTSNPKVSHVGALPSGVVTMP